MNPNGQNLEPAGRPFSWLLFSAGVIVTPIVNLAINLLSWSAAGSAAQISLLSIALAWLATAGIVLLSFKLHYWFGWGLLGGFALLFIFLLVTGGMFGPYGCFGVYGFPRGSR
jgi:hypothetical protein